MTTFKNADDGFFARLHEAEAAGLNKEWALKVAYKEVTLDDALGDANMDEESAVEYDPNFMMYVPGEFEDDEEEMPIFMGIPF